MPHRSRLQTSDLTLIALFSVLIAICAWITIPFTVPFTLQTFAVFLALSTMGGQRGFYTVLVYLLLGAAGFPVFSGFQGGIGILLGPSGGYLLGFLLTTLTYRAITGHCGTASRSFACLVGLVACYGFGTLWFWLIHAQTGSAGWLSILGWCVFPFLLPDLLKLGLALWLAPRLKTQLK